MRILVLVVLLALIPALSMGAEPIFKAYAGGNAVWYDGVTTLPSDFELGGTVRASLSPHISVVGGTFFGLQHEYLRAHVGPRLTISDVLNPDFSIGVGIQYQLSSEPTIRPQEWCPEVSLGWKPWPETMPAVVIGAQGAYGLDSKLASTLIAVRYFLGSF